MGTFFWGSNIMGNLASIDAADSSSIALQKYFQIVSQFGMFIFPVLLFAFLDGGNISSYLKINIKPSLRILILSGCCILLALPFINFLSEINMKMKLPESFAGIEQWMRESEDKAGQVTVMFLNVSTIWGFLINLFMIGIIPAVGEEFLFRGVVQPLFFKWTKNIHVAVIISAFLFSAIHFQFYGFIPRFLMGVLLGYSFVWTGSLWVPIFIHFVNNSAAVIVSYLVNNQSASNAFDTIGTGENALMPVIISIIFTTTTLFLIYQISKKKNIHIL
ncbi:MAG TPA: CPBP family intramembrane metalloprotease [Bacteroidales bacterium]|nr:CPBP family intramembrane metalloprotease [Bacteroidales bacterium]HPS16501.1 CPBP family intramembrane metalloprotease [Bacteroidales bacterium]